MELSDTDHRSGFSIGTLSKLSDLGCMYSFEKESNPRRLLSTQIKNKRFVRCFENTFETLCRHATTLEGPWPDSPPTNCFSNEITRILTSDVTISSYEKKVLTVLCYRLDVIQYYTKKMENCSKTKFLLYLFLDEHIDLYNECLSRRIDNVGTIRGLFPSPSRICFWGNLLNTMPFIKESGYWNLKYLKRHPLIHLFTKTLPHRCQNRNMQTLTLKYMKENPLMKILFGDILRCSMLGNYINSKPINFNARCLIYKRRADSGFWLSMIEKFFPVMLHALKEYILFAVEQIPSLFKILVQKQRWLEFKEGIKRILIPARVLLADDNCKVKTLEEILLIMQQMSKYNLGRHIHHHTTAFNLYETRFKATTRRVHTLLQLDSKMFMPEHFKLLYNLTCRISYSDTIPWYILIAFGVPRHILKSLYGTKRRTELFCARRHKLLINTFLDAMALRFGIQCYNLPHRLMKRQRETMLKKLKLPISTSDEIISRSCMPMIFCSRCKSFKGFLNFVTDKGKKVYGYGNKNILVDDYTQQLYCANHKNIKHQVKKANNSIISMLQNDVKLKGRKRTSKYSMCGKTQLLQFQSYGNCVVFFGEMYMLCPSCMSPSCFSKMVFSKGFLMCTVCAVSTKV